MTQQPSDWHNLAEQTSKELDPVKLMTLVDELNRVLARNERTSQGATESSDVISLYKGGSYGNVRRIDAKTA